MRTQIILYRSTHELLPIEVTQSREFFLRDVCEKIHTLAYQIQNDPKLWPSTGGLWLFELGDLLNMGDWSILQVRGLTLHEIADLTSGKWRPQVS